MQPPIQINIIIEKILLEQILKVCGDHPGILSAKVMSEWDNQTLTALQIEFEDAWAAYNLGMTYGLLLIRNLGDSKNCRIRPAQL